MNASSDKCPKCGKLRVTYLAQQKLLERAWRVFHALSGMPPAGFSKWCHRCSFEHFQIEGRKRQKKDDGTTSRAGENKASLGPFRFGTGGGRRVIRSSKGLY